MGLIGVFFLAVLGIFGASISGQLTDEFKAWTPWLVNYFIRRAVRQLPENQRKRRDEEWRSHVNDIPGEIGKLYCALGYLSAAWKISRDLTDDDISYAVAKRVFDFALGATTAVFLLPTFAICAVLIWRRPFFIVQPRVGHKGNTITLLRFRTMGLSESGLAVTKAGKILRKVGLDVLPQLFNLLSGRLSLVGPRPLRMSELDLINERLPWLSRRMNVKPGLYGWAMVHGFGREPTTLEELKSELEHDLYYVDNRSFLLDLKILLLGSLHGLGHKNILIAIRRFLGLPKP